MERARLSLRAYKAGKKEHVQVRWMMAPEQGPEFNRLIGLMNAVNYELGMLVFVLHEQVEQLDLKWAWLLSVQMWAHEPGRCRRLPAPPE